MYYNYYFKNIIFMSVFFFVFVFYFVMEVGGGGIIPFYTDANGLQSM